MLRFRCLGFSQPSNEEDAKRLLHEIAGRARHESPTTLLCEPFEGASIRIHLDEFGDPLLVDTQLDSPLQPFFVESLTPSEHGQGNLLLFSSQDGKPVAPVQALTKMPKEPMETGTICFAEIWGFADSAILASQPEPLFAAEQNLDSSISARGHLVKSWTKKNKLTGETANLTTIYFPGFLTSIAFAETVEINPGEVIECKPTFYASISSRKV